MLFLWAFAYLIHIFNNAGELVPGDDEAARGGPGAQRPGGQLLQPEPGGGGTAGLCHLLLQGREQSPEGGLRHASNIRLEKLANVRIETQSKCSNWDSKLLLKAGLQSPKRCKDAIRHHTPVSVESLREKCLKLGSKSVSVGKNLCRICFVSCIKNFFARFYSTNNLPPGSMCNCVQYPFTNISKNVHNSWRHSQLKVGCLIQCHGRYTFCKCRVQ